MISPNSSTHPSCHKCLEIVETLNDHISEDHASSINSAHIAYLNNIIWNLLSLITHSTDSQRVDKDKQVDKNTTSQVESNGSKISSEKLSVCNSQTVPISVISQNKPVEKEGNTEPNLKEAIKEGTFTKPNFKLYNAQERLNITSPIELTPKMAFQPDVIGNDFLNNSISNTQNNDLLKKTKENNLKQNKIFDQVDQLTQLISNSSGDFGTVSSALLTPDGNFTAAGISLLLANQQRNMQSSGKSDLDVADILVNKMPIPSLNKGLDPNFLQLSTLYLQQLALNQQTQALVSGSSSEVTSTYPGKEIKQQQKVLQRQDSQQQQLQLTQQQKVAAKNKPEKQTEKVNDRLLTPECSSTLTDTNLISLQQLILEHKKISGQIESLNSKGKQAGNIDAQQKVKSPPSNQTSYVFDPLSQSFVVENPIIAISQQHQQTEMQSASSQSTLATLLPVSQVVYSKPPENNPSNNKEAVSEENSGEVRNNKESGVYLDTETVNENNVEFVRHEVIPMMADGAPKPPTFYALQNLVIQTPPDSQNNEKTDIQTDTDLSRKRKYSAITMVPISQYDTLAGDTEPAPRSSKDEKVLLSCKICGVTFTVFSTLESHMKTHVNDTVEECNYCHQTFTDNDEFYEHIASHRGEENILRCPHCPKIFTSKGHYTKHIADHAQNRPYQCSHCKKAFKDPGSLTKHERIHTGEQPFICDICSRGFAEKSSLSKHMRTHSGEKPYKCDQCDKRFSISGNLHRHMFIHTGQRPFKCTSCSKAFNNASHLKRHIKNIHQKQTNDNKPVSDITNNGFVIPRQTESQMISLAPNVINTLSDI